MSIRIAIMGAGSIARKFAQATRLTEGVELCAVASKSQERADAFAAELNMTKAFGSYEDMLGADVCDLVYVATTNNFHVDNALQCIAHHKHVLCEKPLAMTRAEAQRLCDAALDAGVFLMEGMWSCFIPTVQKARQWIADGRIGMVSLATYTGGINVPYTHRIFNKALGGGALYDLGCYPIEIVNCILGELPINIRWDLRFGSETDVDESGCLLLKYAHTDAAIQVTAHARIPSPSCFYGNLGYIRLEQTHRAGVVELFDGQFALVERFEHPVENGFEFELAHVRDCIAQGKQQSDVLPWSATLKCAEIFDIVLGERGWNA